MGITKMEMWKYALGGLGMIPGTVVYVYFGTAISDISDVISGNTNGGTLQLIFLIVGTILAFAAIVYVSYYLYLLLLKMFNSFMSIIY